MLISKRWQTIGTSGQQKRSETYVPIMLMISLIRGSSRGNAYPAVHLWVLAAAATETGFAINHELYRLFTPK
ncbi:hypothetical protein ZHAS_00010095 [Anopheles sinensis]|uniref:Uncharacterized protein n=1 Tax=Anopheles sinensis TaxID=74873 RepID=A0A084VWQ7_ANOSI|nr:hypothetical protein ZHAS_00010095 [Anopheles sinensis]